MTKEIKGNEIDVFTFKEELLINDTIDIDLTDEIESDYLPDFVLVGSDAANAHDDKVNSIVSVASKDLTIRTLNRQDLAKMANGLLLDASDFQKKKIIHPHMDKANILNAYREIRTKLIQKSGNKNFVIMVVSFKHGMGATFNAVNLSAAFSYEGEKTSIIVDCNKNKPKLDKYFPTDSSYGLTDYLDDNQVETDKIIYQTGIPRMRFIPAGKRKETVGEFFSSEKMRAFIESLKRRYRDRYVILNSPPLEESADASILSEISDYILIVLPYGKISNSKIKSALKVLPKEKIVGFILNDKKKYF